MLSGAIQQKSGRYDASCTDLAVYLTTHSDWFLGWQDCFQACENALRKFRAFRNIWLLRDRGVAELRTSKVLIDRDDD
jgi:hypothetical protein